MKRTLAAGALVLTFVCLAMAANFWVSKPYTQWSHSDAARMLTDSPWSKTTTLTTGTISGRSRGGPQPVNDSQEEPMVRYAVSIRSAMPVRQANVRMAALANKYDKMDAAAKQEFDDKWNKYLAATFPNNIVVAINYDSNDPDRERQLLRYFQAQTLETMKPSTWLTLPDGKKLEPLAFAVGPHEMQIAFPRPQDLAAGMSFTIDFLHPDVTDISSRRVSTKFVVKDMMFNGAFAL